MTVQEYISENRNNMVQDLADFIRFKTYLDTYTAGEEKPFGSGIAEGLEWLLRKGTAFGMDCRNVDGYAGEICCGKGDFVIGILAHEDVVQAGEGWETEPFEAVITEDRIIGRGSSDDKGPLISCLYAMKYLKEENLIPAGVQLRMIVGTDEEELWRGIDYYKAHTERLPDYSIVPDGYFPLIFCEKGMFDFDLDICNERDADALVQVMEIEGGTARNVVPGKAKMVLKAPEKVCEIAARHESVKCCYRNGYATIETEGKSTHAMAPENGISAISILMKVLEDIDDQIGCSISGFVKKYQKYIGADYNAGLFGCGFADDISGKTTINVGVMRYKKEKIHMEINLRYPAAVKKGQVFSAIEKTVRSMDAKYTEVSYLPPIYIDPESDFIRELMDVYVRNTGDTKTAPLAIGGATYARAVENSVAFGALFPGEKELAHEPNEFLRMESFVKMTAIYAEALIALMNMKH